MYASFLGISEALHLGILKQPQETGSLDRLLREINAYPFVSKNGIWLDKARDLELRIAGS